MVAISLGQHWAVQRKPAACMRPPRAVHCCQCTVTAKFKAQQTEPQAAGACGAKFSASHGISLALAATLAACALVGLQHIYCYHAQCAVLMLQSIAFHPA